MRHHFPVFAALSVLSVTALAACTGTGRTYTVDEHRCNATEHSVLIGRNWGDVRLPPSLNVRLIESGEVVSQDYTPSRLNLIVDPKGWIGAITCG